MKKTFLRREKNVFIIWTIGLLFIFSVQSAAQIEFLGDTVTASWIQSEKNAYLPNYEYQTDGFSFSALGDNTKEGLKLIIGAPAAVDMDWDLNIYVAGLRNAKATYITPSSMKINLWTANDGDSLPGEGSKNYLLASRTGYLDAIDKTDGPEGTWKYENYGDPAAFVLNVTGPITRLASNLPLYNATFGKIGVETTVRVEVQLYWRAPWGETLYQTASKTVIVAPWENFESLLASNAADIDNTIVGGATKANIDLKSVTEELRTSIDSVDYVFTTFAKVEECKSSDPGLMHMYLLNMTQIVDPNNPNSYVSKLEGTLNDVNTPKGAYYQKIQEINQAYIQSKEYLIRKGIEIIETVVNYTYEMHWDPLTMHEGFGGTWDADWDEEHLEDCSLEFLLEGNVWSGNPYLMHVPYIVDITQDISSGSPTIIDIKNGGLGYPIINDQQYYLQFVLSDYRKSTYTSIYEGNYSLVLVDKTTNEKTYIDSSNIIHIDDHTFSISGVDVDDATDYLYLEITPPGGIRKANRAVVVNLMYNTFPLPSRLYAIPRDLIDGGHNVNETTYVGDRYPNDPDNRYYKGISNNSYNEAPLIPDIYALEFTLNATNNLDYLALEAPLNPQTVAYSPRSMNLSDYVMAFSPFLDGNPFYVNTICKPFESFVYDSNANGYTDENREWGMYDAVYTDTRLTEMLDEVFQNPDEYNDGVDESQYLDIYDIMKGENFPIFSLMDQVMSFTSDQMGGTIIPRKTMPYEWFYKNDYGRWIDAFFNGTRLDGYTLERLDMASAYPNAWTFTYIDQSVLQGLDTLPPAPEYMLSPFQGPFDAVPIGLMTGQHGILIQNSLANLTAGFGYSYGMIYLTYRRAYDATRSIIAQMMTDMANNFNRRSVITTLSKDLDDLDTAWNTLNTTGLNDIINRTIEYMTNVNEMTSIPNPYYGMEPSQIQQILNVENAYYLSRGVPQAALPRIAEDQIVTEDGYILYDYRTSEQNVSYIDGILLWAQWKLDNLTAIGSDVVETGAVMDGLSGDGQTEYIMNRIRNFAIEKIKPLIRSALETMIKFIEQATTPFIEFFDETLPNFLYEQYNKTSGWMERALNPLGHWLSDQTDWIQAKANQVADWIQEGAEWLFSKVDDALGQVYSWIDDNVLEPIFGKAEELFVKLNATLDPFRTGIWAMAARICANIRLGERPLTTIVVGYMNFRQEVGNYLTDWTQDNVLERDWFGLYKNADEMLATMTNTVGSISQNIGGSIMKLQKFLIDFVRQGIDQAYILFDQLLLLIDTLNATIQLFVNMFKKAYDHISAAFNTVSELIAQAGEFLKAAVGKSFEFVVDLSQSIYPQLATLETELLKNDGFLTTMDFFYPPFKKARLASGYIDYSLGFGQMSEDTFNMWVEVYQPMAMISGANQGFYVYQIGNEFTEQLFILTEFRGRLIDTFVNSTVQRYVNYENFGMPTDEDDPSWGPVEGIINSYKCYYPGTNDVIPGIRYVNFTEGDLIPWFKDKDSLENYDPEDPDTTDAFLAAPEGLYMTFIESYYDSNGDSTYENYTSWTELTYLFRAEFIQDAWIEIDIQNDGVNDDATFTAQAGGIPISINLKIWNEMWSNPNISIQLFISSDDGYPIAQADYAPFPVAPGGMDPVDKQYTLRIGRYAPGGNHSLVILAREPNGDIKSIYARIIVEQNSILATFLFEMTQWQNIVLLTGGLGVMVTGITYGQIRKRRKSVNITVGRNVVGPCTYDEVINGMCGQKNPTFDRTEWVCDPVTRKCYYVPKRFQ